MPTPVKAELTSRRVLGALGEMDFDLDSNRISVEDLASYLVAPEDDIAHLVRELEARRLVRRIRRKGRTVLIPWKGQTVG